MLSPPPQWWLPTTQILTPDLWVIGRSIPVHTTHIHSQRTHSHPRSTSGFVVDEESNQTCAQRKRPLVETRIWKGFDKQPYPQGPTCQSPYSPKWVFCGFWCHESAFSHLPSGGMLDVNLPSCTQSGVPSLFCLFSCLVPFYKGVWLLQLVTVWNLIIPWIYKSTFSSVGYKP